MYNYKKSGVTLNEAYQTNDKVRVETTVGEKLKFKYIVFEEGVYYGVKNKKGKIIKLPLDSDYIDKVQLKDKTGSTILTIAIPVSIIGLGALILSNGLRWKNGSINLYDFDDN